MFLSYLTLFTALAISSVAIWYSVAGLVAIFAAAAIPIMIMGGTLEAAKLVTAVWLHRYWHQATWWLKTYLVAAVLVLMFITSMGIFGFLSNAHIQQTAQGDNTVAELERIESEIARQKAIISRAEDKIDSVQNRGVGGDSNLQTQIDREQERIDRAYARAEPLINEQREIIEQVEGRVLSQIDSIESDIDKVDTAIATGNISLAQNLIGVTADGVYGPNTREAVENYRNRKSQEKLTLETRLSQISDSPRVVAAREEIERIRNRTEQQVAQSNQLINRLRSQLGQTTGEDIDAVIDEQNQRITDASSSIDELTQEKFEIEAKFRQLEAEVGPIKYIAEFVYGEDADKNLLEEAVRWVIVIIIFVFDPLAVLLLIASQYTFRWHGRELFGKDDKTPPPPPPEPDLSEETGEIYTDTDTHNVYNDDRLATIHDLEGSAATTHEHDAYSAQHKKPANRFVNSWSFNQASSAYDYELTDSYPNVDINNKVGEETAEVNEDVFYVTDIPEDDVQDDSYSSVMPHELSTGYVEYKGKRYTKDVFRHLYPEFQLTPDNIEKDDLAAGFGTEFPTSPRKGDLFLRVDYLPTRLFKWSGQKWISIDKEQTDQYAYQDAYIDHLIDKISSGEYDPEMLTDFERSQLEQRLKST